MSPLNNKNTNRMFAMDFKRNKQVFISLALISYVAFVGAAETITYFHNDALGSPVAATDELGNILWREAYKPYGNRIRKEDNGTNDTWYTGKKEDKATGLSYFGARWYDPTIGRFMGVDPVGFKESNIHSFNRYAYANNNPYKFVDPDGKEPEDFQAARMMMKKVFKGYKVPTMIECDNCKEVRPLMNGVYNKDKDRITINTYSNEHDKDLMKSTLNNKEAENLLNTYFHEVLHPNQDPISQYIITNHGGSSIEKKVHSNVEKNANKLTKKFSKEYHSLRKNLKSREK